MRLKNVAFFLHKIMAGNKSKEVLVEGIEDKTVA
jgi:hypothetical protein